jgi:hypothetical protein
MYASVLSKRFQVPGSLHGVIRVDQMAHRSCLYVTAFNDAETFSQEAQQFARRHEKNANYRLRQSHRTKYNQSGVTLHGIIVAPFNDVDEVKDIDEVNSVTILSGAQAMDRLGGLSQFGCGSRLSVLLTWGKETTAAIGYLVIGFFPTSQCFLFQVEFIHKEYHK